MVKLYRQRKGLSQDALGNIVGLRRQAIYDMEAGRYMPNTTVALHMAQVLGCSVEMLFALPQEQPAPTAIAVSAQASLHEGARLAVAKVGERLVGVPLQGNEGAFALHGADAIATTNGIALLHSPALITQNVLVFGCDPALALLQDICRQHAPKVRAHTLFASSGKALQTLAAGSAHIAGIHYHSSDTQNANTAAVHKTLPGTPCLVLAFARQEEGLMVASGNPLGIRGVEDFGSSRITLANREQGAALRTLLDAELARLGIPATLVKGYDSCVTSHNEGANRVAMGMAHAALGVRVVAEAYGLAFIPIATTQCDLVIPHALEEHGGVSILLNLMQSATWQQQLRSVPGYDATVTGTIVQR